PGCLALVVNEGNELFGDIGVVLRLHPTAMEWMRAFIIKGIALHAVDAEDADTSLLDVRAEGADHGLPFLLELVAHAGGKGEDGPAVIAVDGDAHVAAESG